MLCASAMILLTVPCDFGWLVYPWYFEWFSTERTRCQDEHVPLAWYLVLLRSMLGEGVVFENLGCPASLVSFMDQNERLDKNVQGESVKTSVRLRRTVGTERRTHNTPGKKKTGWILYYGCVIQV